MSQLSRRSVLLGIGAVGAFLAIDLGAVAYANKWIGPRSLTRETFMDGFRTVFGLHPGFRRNHAKGVVVNGYFDSNGNGRELSKAALFTPGRTPVIGRFSLSGGNPTVADAPGVAHSWAGPLSAKSAACVSPSPRCSARYMRKPSGGVAT